MANKIPSIRKIGADVSGVGVVDDFPVLIKQPDGTDILVRFLLQQPKLSILVINVLKSVLDCFLQDKIYDLEGRANLRGDGIRKGTGVFLFMLKRLTPHSLKAKICCKKDNKNDSHDGDGEPPLGSLSNLQPAIQIR